MKAVDVYRELRSFGRPVITTEDVALRLRMQRSAASWTLARLEKAGLVTRLRRGLWSTDPRIDPLALPEYLTAPSPSYVSFQSALYLHGMISQIPQVIYAASLAQTRKVRTTVGTYSIHQLKPEFFGGYETVREGVRLATPEKALLDVLYLAAARSRMFARLPEIELPRGFDERKARQWLRVLPLYRRTMVSRRLEAVLSGSRSA